MNNKTENRLKSYFLTILVTYSVVLFVAGAFYTTMTEHHGIWLAVTIAAALIALFFARLYIMKVPRTSPGLAGFSIGILAATVYAIFTSYQLQIVSAAPMLALLCLAGWAGYVGWYSELGDRSKEKIKVGKPLPIIPLEDYDGNSIHSDDWKGEKRLVIFYRGNWCPICTAQVNELSKYEKEFEELHIKVALISPQAHKKSRQHALRTGMKYDFLVDVDNKAAAILGILNEGGLPKGFEVLGYETDVPKPTTFILDEKGTVIYADQTTNYRVRPKPDDMLAAIKA